MLTKVEDAFRAVLAHVGYLTKVPSAEEYARIKKRLEEQKLNPKLPLSVVQVTERDGRTLDTVLEKIRSTTLLSLRRFAEAVATENIAWAVQCSYQSSEGLLHEGRFSYQSELSMADLGIPNSFLVVFWEKTYDRTQSYALDAVRSAH